MLAEQAALRLRMEREPVEFLVRQLEDALDEARAALGSHLGADPQALVFVPNATAGVNAVLRSLELEPGGELLTTDHAYNAVRAALAFAADRNRCEVRVARVPFPVASEDEVVEAVLGAAGARTRLAVIDHVTSPTALIFPLERLVSALAERGIDSLVDGAHAPGMLPLDLDALGAAYYAGNCHKWLCAPKGAGFLHVRADRRERVRPLAISHGANSPRSDRSRFHLEFDWTGTLDPTPWLCVPAAIRCIASLLPGGWPGVMERNRALALAARSLLAARLGSNAPCPEAMVGSMASMMLPGAAVTAARGKRLDDPLRTRLFERYRIEVPVLPAPGGAGRIVRISAQLYNRLEHYERLAGALEELLRGSGAERCP